MSDYIANNFLPEDHEQAIKQLNCYVYNTNLAKNAYEREDQEKSFVYFENAHRPYEELKKMRDKHDAAWHIKEQLVSAYD